MSRVYQLHMCYEWYPTWALFVCCGHLGFGGPGEVAPWAEVQWRLCISVEERIKKKKWWKKIWGSIWGPFHTQSCMEQHCRSPVSQVKTVRAPQGRVFIRTLHVCFGSAGDQALAYTGSFFCAFWNCAQVFWPDFNDLNSAKVVRSIPGPKTSAWGWFATLSEWILVIILFFFWLLFPFY